MARPSDQAPIALVSRLGLADGQWGLGVLAALYVAPVLISPSDAVAQGHSLTIVVAALIALVAWSIWILRPESARVRIGWLDLVVLLLMAWIGLSGWMMADEGSLRFTFNACWIWVGLTVSYWLARQWLCTAEDCRAIVAVMLALAVVEAVFGLYQSTYARPRDLAIYERDPDRVLREIGIAAPEGSPLRTLYDSRMRDTEPLGTGSLTNSLAGYLAPWLTLALGVALAEYWRRQPTANQPPVGNENPRSEQRFEWAHLFTKNNLRRWGPLVLALALVGVCLLLTKSRSAYLATLGGMACLGIVALRSRWRIPGWWWGAGVGGGALVIAITSAVGLLDREVLTEARKSLGVRWEYWQATSSLIADHPIWGCGPGNFQTYYAYYKAPQSSETVADPHNWLFEAAANAGLPAALLLVVFVVAIAWKLVGPAFFFQTALANGTTPDAPPLRSGPHVDATATGTRGFAKRGWAYFGGTIGLALSGLASFIGPAPPDGFVYWFAVPCGVIVVWWLDDWVQYGTLPGWSMGVAIVVLMVNLFAAGSLAFPSVSGTLWLLAACGLCVTSQNRTSNPAPSRPATTSGEPQRTVSRPVGLVCVVASAALFFGGLTTGFRPAMLGQLHLILGDQDARQGFLKEAESEFRTATEHDRWSSEPWGRLATLAQRRVIENPQSEQAWASLETNAAEALRRNRRSHTQRREFGDLFLELWRQTGDERALRQAVEHYSFAIRLYPNSNILHAHRAWFLHLSGADDEAQRAAHEAVRLDELNPHHEQRLAEQRVFDRPSGVPGQPQSSSGENALQLMQRLTSRK